MATIGKLTRNGENFVGNIETLTISAAIRMEPAKGDSLYRVLIGSYEVGAAWKKTSKKGTSYLSVRIDDHSFAKPLDCVLLLGSDTCPLIWERRRPAA